MTRSTLRRGQPWIAALVVLAGTAGALGMTTHEHGHGHGAGAHDRDMTLSKPTDNGLYIGTMEAGIDPVAVGPMHSWTLTVTTPDGVGVEGAAIAIAGDMPEHGHGLPSAPRVTEELGEGRYLIEGVKFNMGGWWTLTVSIDAAAGADTATFNIEL